MVNELSKQLIVKGQQRRTFSKSAKSCALIFHQNCSKPLLMAFERFKSRKHEQIYIKLPSKKQSWQSCKNCYWHFWPAWYGKSRDKNIKLKGNASILVILPLKDKLQEMEVNGLSFCRSHFAGVLRPCEFKISSFTSQFFLTLTLTLTLSIYGIAWSYSRPYNSIIFDY